MATDRDEPVFRPRMGRRPRPRDRAHRSFRSVLMAAVQASRRSQPHSRRARVAAAVPGHDARRVTVKVLVVRLRGGGAQGAARHLRYIQRDGVEKDGSPGTLYDARGPVRGEVFEQPRPDERHQFRTMVSPEYGGELELTEYVRHVMARVERDLGRDLGQSLRHRQPPRAGRETRSGGRCAARVPADRRRGRRRGRWRAQEVATEELGPRPEFEIRRAHERDVRQERSRQPNVAYDPSQSVWVRPMRIEAQGLGWKSSFGTGKGADAITSGLEVTWTTTPTKWSNNFFWNLFGYEWELTKSPAGAHQWTPKGGMGASTVPHAHDPSKRIAPSMLTTDLSLRFAPAYEKISRRFMEHPDQFAVAGDYEAPGRCRRGGSRESFARWLDR